MATIKATLKHLIPPAILNSVLLKLPFLYRTPLVDYETNLRPHLGIEDLLGQLDLALKIDGDIVECGCSRCGSTVIMAERLRSIGAQRMIYACDSFEGFDRAELKREREAGLTDAAEDSFTSTSFQYVQAKLHKLGVVGLVTPIKGYFQHTLPRLDKSFCMVFIDCDLRDSLIYCAETLWPKLRSGGRMLFDDYADPEFKGARMGVDEFVRKYSGEIAEHKMLNRLYMLRKH